MGSAKDQSVLKMREEDIAALQEALCRLGYRLPPEEIENQAIASGTRNAIRQFQQQHNLKASGAFDKRTVKTLKSAAKAFEKSSQKSCRDDLGRMLKTLQIKIPAEWVNSLAEHNIRTLADIRAAGGLAQLKGLSLPPDDPRIAALEAHANLEILTDDLKIRSRLIEKEFYSIVDFASAGQAEITQHFGEFDKLTGTASLRDLQQRAKALVSLVSNYLLGILTDPSGIKSAGPLLSGLESGLEISRRQKISALSPIAYLNDLLNYAHQNLTPTRGLQATYRNLQSSPYYNPQAAAQTHLAPNIDIQWGSDSPAPGIDPAEFLVEWSGYISPVFRGEYVFTLLTNTSYSGGRLQIANQSSDQILAEIYEEYAGAGKTEGSITLEESKLYKISVNLLARQNPGDLKPFAKLYWTCKGKQAQEIVPRDRFYPRPPEFNVADSAALTRMFYQPFADSANSAEAAAAKFRQVRLCIEILRQYWLSLDQKKLPDLANRKQDLLAKQKSYYETAYQSLLACLNTSAEELRQAICADFQTRQELADRLGFDLEPRLAILVCGDFDGDCVDEIVLFPQTAGAPGKPFQVLKYEAKTKSWSRLVREPDIPYGSDFGGGRLLETAKFAVAGHFTSREYADLAIAGAYGPGAGFRVIGCEFSPEQAPVGWQRRNQKAEGFEFYCSGYVDARFAAAGDFDGDGLDELAIAADLNGCNAFWVMDYNQDGKTWDSLGTIPGHEFNAGFVCNQQGLVGTARFAVVGDFDGDGLEELAVAIAGPGAPGGSFWVMKWDAGSKDWTHLGKTGSFPHGKTGSLPLNADFSCGGSGPAYQAAAGNFTGGGSPARDLAVVLDGPNPGEYRIQTMKYNTARKEWKEYATYTFESHSADFLLLAGDFNNDWVTELAIIQTNSGEKDKPVLVLKLKKVMGPIHHTEQWLWDVLDEVAMPELLGTGNIQGNNQGNH